MSNLQALLSVAKVQLVEAEQNERGSDFRVAQRHIVKMTYNTIALVAPQAEESDFVKSLEKLFEWCDKEGFLVAAEVCQECIQCEKELL